MSEVPATDWQTAARLKASRLRAEARSANGAIQGADQRISELTFRRTELLRQLSEQEQERSRYIGNNDSNPVIARWNERIKSLRTDVDLLNHALEEAQQERAAAQTAASPKIALADAAAKVLETLGLKEIA